MHDSVRAVGGSISAEHGIGQLTRDALVRYKDPVELAMMHSLKQALDPHGIMNPGKVLAGGSGQGVRCSLWAPHRADFKLSRDCPICLGPGQAFPTSGTARSVAKSRVWR
ncbi:MAG: FAD-linked oxidase C-terminal domain-containing protein [Rhodanobacteraceae bacterium]